jgi:thymidylate kinase
MIVIIEGTDLVGKSTLAERLAADLGWPVVKLRWDLIGDPKVETTAMAKATLAMLDALRPDVIFDRSFLSWWAYGPVLGHDVSYLPRLAGWLAQIPDVYVVLLTATREELERRFTREPDKWFDLRQITAANERFPGIEGLLPGAVPRLAIDTTSAGPAEVYECVRAFLGLS